MKKYPELFTRCQSYAKLVLEETYCMGPATVSQKLPGLTNKYYRNSSKLIESGQYTEAQAIADLPLN